MSLTKTQALRRASLHVSHPHRAVSGPNKWLVYKPHKMTSSEVACSVPFEFFSYSTALQQRANYIASIALHLLGYTGDEYQTGSDSIDYDSTYTAASEGYIPAKALLNLAIIAINESRVNNETI